MEKVLITGGTGFVGRHIVKGLQTKGYDIHLLVRNPNKAIDLFGESHSYHRIEDLTNTEKLREIINKIKPDYIIHLIGIIQEHKSKGITFEKVHYEYSKSLYEVLKEMPPKKIIHMSALGVDDRAPSKYHSTKLMAEKELQKTNIPHVIIRPSFILGPEQLLFIKLKEILNKTPLILFPDIKGYFFQPVDVRDVAEAFINSIKYENNSIFELCGDERKTLKDIVNDFVHLLKKNVLFLPLPKSALEIFASDQYKMMWRDNVCGLSNDALSIEQILGKKPIPYYQSIRWSAGISLSDR